MSAADRYVTTADIRKAVRGRETDVLNGLNIDWRRPKAKPHITCPYRDHTDNHPSWRWDTHKKRALHLHRRLARDLSGGHEDRGGKL
jgi:hypothetical protein